MSLYDLIRPALFTIDAETAHKATIAALKAMPRRAPPVFAPRLGSTVAGLHFPSPVGLAAGFDKDADVPDAMLGLGFGFVEVGTLTPHPQAGNPRPRLFRLVEDQAVINRMGFNNRGQEEALLRLRQRRRAGVVGVNIGANKDSADRVGDYVQGVRRMAGVADYLTINISSPNTPGLRNLQAVGELEELLAAVRDARPAGGPPIFLKVAPDLDECDPPRLVRAALDHAIDGLIVANTTLSRPLLGSRHRDEVGGLSGAPLGTLAFDQLRAFHAAADGTLPLISAGGVSDANDAWRRIRAGASLVQLYSGLVYHGPGLARRIATGLEEKLAATSFATIADAVGSE